MFLFLLELIRSVLSTLYIVRQSERKSERTRDREKEGETERDKQVMVIAPVLL